MTFSDYLMFFLGCLTSVVVSNGLMIVLHYTTVAPIFPWPWKRTIIALAASIAGGILSDLANVSDFSSGFIGTTLVTAAVWLHAGIKKDDEWLS